jgi:hypothetical protein
MKTPAKNNATKPTDGQRMTFREKLRSLGAGVNKSARGVGVGLKPNTISTYMVKGSIPRADIALKMARALGVDVAWLIDDAAPWPPPAPHLAIVAAGEVRIAASAGGVTVISAPPGVSVRIDYPKDTASARALSVSRGASLGQSAGNPQGCAADGLEARRDC